MSVSISDEESFVILGSTPTPSMNNHFDQIDAARSVIRSPTTIVTNGSAAAAARDAIMQASQPFSMLDSNGGASIGPASNGTGMTALTNGTNGGAPVSVESNALYRSVTSEAPQVKNKLQVSLDIHFPLRWASKIYAFFSPTVGQHYQLSGFERRQRNVCGWAAHFDAAVQHR